MIVSWNWLQDYLELQVDPGEVARRLMMAGLNHESSTPVGRDLAIDLEVTSNRPDCLGHLGVAREISVLFDLPLRLPTLQLPAMDWLTTQAKASASTSLAPQAHQEVLTARSSQTQGGLQLTLESSDLCYRYSARVIRGVRVGPSPAWLVDRLKTVGLSSINNVVDVTNYVLMECGQPLHAFDFARLGGSQIRIRRAELNEPFVAIDHRTYLLDPTMCVIADSTRPVALGGVMGGAETEVSDATTELLIEAAEFAPLAIRTTARKLHLHSPSSYRFERGVDPRGVDWASRRCCELILQLAGGEVMGEPLVVGHTLPALPTVCLRLDQIPRILGIQVPTATVRRILTALGCQEQQVDAQQVEYIPPSWRRDLTREIDLIEEVARIHGYDQIPEDAAVPMCPSSRTHSERIQDRLRQVLMAGGFDEAFTVSMVPREWSEAFSPWTTHAPLTSSTPMKGILAEAPQDLSAADTIRRSLIPSLLEARRYNESVGNTDLHLFETARVYLPMPSHLPLEKRMLGLVSDGDFFQLKGLLEGVLQSFHIHSPLLIRPTSQSLLDTNRAAELQIGDSLWGYLGEVSPAARKRFGLKARTAIAEVDITLLEQLAQLVPQYAAQETYPGISRDINLVVAESVCWADLAATVRQAGAGRLREVSYRETYRDAQKDGPDRKRILLSLDLRASDRTLTNEEADQIRDTIIAACEATHHAKLLAHAP